MSRRKQNVEAESASTRVVRAKVVKKEPQVVEMDVNAILQTKVKLKHKNQKQKEFTNLIEGKEIVICSGPAGVGKSYVAIAKALELIQSTSNNFKKIVILKPAVEADENLGFLPGNLKEKMEPYLASSIDIVDKLVGVGNRTKLEEAGIIQIEPLGFIRGKSIDNSILLMEESQNMSPKQMKTLLTRIGENTKYVISGDLDQSDKYDDVTKSGLYDAIHRLKSVDEIGFFTFDEDDIVRNPLITKILKTYRPAPIVETKKASQPEYKIKTNHLQPKDKQKLSFFGKIKKFFKENFTW